MGKDSRNFPRRPGLVKPWAGFRDGEDSRNLGEVVETLGADNNLGAGADLTGRLEGWGS